MDWKAVAPIIGAVAPLAGSILGGLIPFPGGSLIGQKFGEIIARHFGVEPTPDKVHAAVSDTVATAGEETARAKINAAMEQARAEIEGFVEMEKAYLELMAKTVAETNETIRQETAGRVQLALQGMREHWFFTAGRPASLWVFNIISLCFGLMLTAATAKTAWQSPDPLKVLSDAWQLFASYFGPLCLVNGIYINARSNEKKAAIENAAPMPNAKPAAPAEKIIPSVAMRKAPLVEKINKSGIIPDPPGSR